VIGRVLTDLKPNDAANYEFLAIRYGWSIGQCKYNLRNGSAKDGNVDRRRTWDCVQMNHVLLVQIRLLLSMLMRCVGEFLLYCSFSKFLGLDRVMKSRQWESVRTPSAIEPESWSRWKPGDFVRKCLIIFNPHYIIWLFRNCYDNQNKTDYIILHTPFIWVSFQSSVQFNRIITTFRNLLTSRLENLISFNQLMLIQTTNVCGLSSSCR
jgi:hypothetical protein